MRNNTTFQPVGPEENKVWIADSGHKGPTVAILGGVHGSEQTGIHIVDHLVENGLNLEEGRVILGLGNPEGAKRNERYIDENLNRNFRELTPEEAEKDPAELPYEVRRGQQLIPHLREADALLDLHDFTHDNDPFIISEPRGFSVAEEIGAPVISNGWAEQDPGGSDGFMESLEKIGICYELGRKDKPEDNLERGHGAVLRFLIAHGMFEGKLPPLFAEHGKPRFIFNEKAFRVKKLGDYELYLPDGIRNFTPLTPGQKIARINGELIVAEPGQVPIFPMKPDEIKKVGEEAFYLGREFTPTA